MGHNVNVPFMYKFCILHGAAGPTLRTLAEILQN